MSRSADDSLEQVGPVSSPCVNWCEWDDAAETCRGCHRSIAEIAGWTSFGNQAKRAILDRIAAEHG